MPKVKPGKPPGIPVKYTQLNGRRLNLVNPVKRKKVKPGKLRCLSEFHGINVSWGKSLVTKKLLPHYHYVLLVTNREQLYFEHLLLFLLNEKAYHLTLVSKYRFHPSYILFMHN